MKTLLIFLSVFLFTSQLQAGTSDRIEGVSKFLIDRANQNYLYFFEQKINDNKNLQCYFNNTVEKMEITGLNELLISKELWRKSLSEDFDILLTRASYKLVGKALSEIKLNRDIFDGYIKFLQKVTLSYKGKDYDLTYIPLDADSELIDLINLFYEDVNAISDTQSYFEKLQIVDQACLPPSIPGGHEEFKQHIKNLFSIHSRLALIIDNFTKHKKVLKLKSSSDNVIQVLTREIPQLKSKAASSEAQEGYEKLIALANDFKDDDSNFVVKALTTLTLMKEVKGSEIAELSEQEFRAMRRYILFFSQIADAGSADEVAAVLRAYTIPPISFFEKRNNLNHWMISSNLGISASEDDGDSGVSKGNNNIYAPVGLQYSIGDGSRSWSFMVAPFDFGYPVSLKLHGIEEDVEFDEIIAPTISVSWGLKDTPIEIGLGYQFGRKTDNASQTDEAIYLHISFDMPLLIFK